MHYILLQSSIRNGFSYQPLLTRKLINCQLWLCHFKVHSITSVLITSCRGTTYVFNKKTSDSLYMIILYSNYLQLPFRIEIYWLCITLDNILTIGNYYIIHDYRNYLKKLLLYEINKKMSFYVFNSDVNVSLFIVVLDFHERILHRLIGS